MEKFGATDELGESGKLKARLIEVCYFEEGKIRCVYSRHKDFQTLANIVRFEGEEVREARTPRVSEGDWTCFIRVRGRR